MQTMNISLPDQLMEFVDEQVGTGRDSSASEYVLELIRDYERRTDEDRLEALILEGLEGERTEMMRQDWIDIREEAFQEYQARQSRN